MQNERERESIDPEQFQLNSNSINSITKLVLIKFDNQSNYMFHSDSPYIWPISMEHVSLFFSFGLRSIKWIFKHWVSHMTGSSIKLKMTETERCLFGYIHYGFNVFESIRSSRIVINIVAWKSQMTRAQLWTYTQFQVQSKVVFSPIDKRNINICHRRKTQIHTFDV